MRWLKKIVFFCLAMCALSEIVAFVYAANGINVAWILTPLHAVFGGNLVVTCVIKITENKRTPKTTAATKPTATTPSAGGKSVG